MPEKGWQRRFEDPIDLGGGRRLITLMDAGDHIVKLPKKEAALPEWQAAIEALMLAVEQGGPTMLARFGVMHALNREGVPNPNRKDLHWLKRDE